MTPAPALRRLGRWALVAAAIGAGAFAVWSVTPSGDDDPAEAQVSARLDAAFAATEDRDTESVLDLLSPRLESPRGSRAAVVSRIRMGLQGLGWLRVWDLDRRLSENSDGSVTARLTIAAARGHDTGPLRDLAPSAAAAWRIDARFEWESDDVWRVVRVDWRRIDPTAAR